MKKNRNNYFLMEKNNFDVMNKQVHDKINQDDKKRNIYTRQNLQYSSE